MEIAFWLLRRLFEESFKPAFMFFVQNLVHFSGIEPNPAALVADVNLHIFEIAGLKFTLAFRAVESFRMFDNARVRSHFGEQFPIFLNKITVFQRLLAFVPRITHD